MSDTRELLRRGVEGFEPMPDAFERVLARRDRKRRNQRIAAGILGIAFFVPAVWVVTTGGAFDRSTPAVPGSETGPTQTAPPPARASAAPDVVRQRTCSVGAGSWLGLTDIGDRIKVRFEVHRSPVGDSWRIVLRHGKQATGVDFFGHGDGQVKFEDTRVASENGDLAVQRLLGDLEGDDGFAAKAVDRQTDQFCHVVAGILE